MLAGTEVELDTSTPDWRALYLFNVYRITVSTIFVASVLADVSPNFLGSFNERLFLITGWIYSSFALLSIFTIKKQYFTFDIQVLGQFLLDILAIVILMHSSGGVNSGLGMLLVIVIAGGSLLTEGRTAFFFAAVASLGVLVHVGLADIYNWFLYSSYTHASMLGVTFFSTAFLAHTLARRVRASEKLAKQRGRHLRFLGQLNAQIVENIQSGIIVIDILEHISLINGVARRLLGIGTEPYGKTLASIAPELALQVIHWHNNRSITVPLFRPATGDLDLIASLKELKEGSILIMLEDATLTAQRAQQLKLASLGRLTASIAHEIRNPLGAISHAGQLLAEYPNISKDVARLTEIIAKNSHRVNTIIENVLQLSRQVPAKTESFNLCFWLQSYIDELLLKEDLKTSDILLSCHCSHVIIYFDPSQLYQVVSNLCENGLRYSQTPPLLELTVGMTEESNRPYLEIQDHGEGMTDKTKAQIFEPFFTTENKGTGLGLYLAREICEANQASLHLRSTSHTGCCFCIFFSSNA